MKCLYPELEPFNSFYLPVDNKHKIYVEQAGNPDGLPVVFLHGGPCSGCRNDHRRFFDPLKYHIVLFDQRGCGRSESYGELENNTTQAIIADMELIREFLGIGKWLVFGGSWGATLALLYAQQFTVHTSAIILRGSFLARQKDLDWFIKGSAGRIFPEQWLQLLNCIPETQHNDPLPAIWEILNGDDEISRIRMAKAWLMWGAQVSVGGNYRPEENALHGSKKLIQQVMMEINFAINHYFIEEGQVLSGCDRLQNIPVTIIHGRNDMVCPMEAANSLYQALPHADYVVLPKGGHIAQGADMVDALVTATDYYAEHLYDG